MSGCLDPCIRICCILVLLCNSVCFVSLEARVYQLARESAPQTGAYESDSSSSRSALAP